MSRLNKGVLGLAIIYHLLLYHHYLCARGFFFPDWGLDVGMMAFGHEDFFLFARDMRRLDDKIQERE